MNAISPTPILTGPNKTLISDPYGSAAVSMQQSGLCPLPLKPSLKAPALLKFEHLRYPYSEATVQRLATRYPNANIGIILDLCNPQLTVVDIDDPSLIQKMINACGNTPLQVSTPSGGRHLYYKHNGEKPKNRLNGERVDVKAGRGYVLAPPSHNGTDSYTFRSGSWADLANVPFANPGVLP